MAYSIQSPFGRIDYYDNYGFDYIAQYNDKDGIMFGNYTKERIKLTPSTSNIVAVFRITKRKPTTPKVSYIVYDIDSYLIYETFGWFGRDIANLLKRYPKTLKYINVTHPKTKHILARINTANNTNY